MTDKEGKELFKPRTSNFGMTPLPGKKQKEREPEAKSDSDVPEQSEPKTEPKRLSKKDLPHFDGKPGEVTHLRYCS